MNLYAIVLSVVTFSATLLGGFVAARYRHRFGIIAAFAGGVLVAVPIFNLLPATLGLAAQINASPANIFYVTGLGFIFLYIMERFFSVRRVLVGDSWKNIRHSQGGWLGAGELSAHSFVDGFAIGIGFHFTFHAGVIVSLAVIAHDFPDGINIVTVMLHSGNTLKSSLRMLLLDAVAPVLGAILSQFVTLSPEYLVYLLPFFAGGFLYLGASDLLPAAHEETPPAVAFAFSLGGFLLIFILTRFLNI